MDIVKAFNTNELHTEIIIKGTHEDPLFRASDIGIILDISSIRSVIRQFNESEKVVHSMHTLGGTQDVTFLTEKGLYKILFKSRKPIAEKFQNWICEVIKELRLTGIFNLQKEVEKAKDETKKEYDQKLIKQQIMDREKILLREYGTIGSIVYIIKIKTFENGQYILKIGESRKGITNRYSEHKSKYEECLLLDCFTVENSKDFESFLHNHDQIKREKVTDLLGHENEQELFLIGNNLSYQSLIQIINNNIKYFNNNDIIKLELENEKLKLMLEMKETNNNNLLIDELIQTVKQLSRKIDTLEKSISLDNKNSFTPQTKVVTGFNEQLVTLGPRLQCIHSETLKLVKVYETVSELMKENNKIKRPSINKAIEENTIYYGFRWLLVDRELHPNVIHKIEPTKITKQKNLGYIAKLNNNKTEIINVYIDRKTAALDNGYISSSALDNPVKKYSLTNNHYYTLYDNCDETLIEEFVEKNNGEPILYKNGVGQFDSNNILVKEFICKYDCIKTLRISDKTLEKALTKNMLYNGHFYKYLDSKIKCF